MGHITISATIDAPVARVWELLADITALAQWSPNVRQCYLLTDHGIGLGAVRFIDHGRKGYLKEEIIAWNPQRELTFRVIETSYPLVTSDIRHILEPRGTGTFLTVDVTYQLKFGVVGRLLDVAFIRRTYDTGMATMMAELKQRAERNARSAAAG